MNRPAAKRFARCAAEDIRRLWFHLRGFVRSFFQP